MRQGIFIATACLMLMASGNSMIQPKQFTPVEGADLRSKLEAARRLAAANSPRAPFWIAYSFSARPGFTVDPEVDRGDGRKKRLDGMLSKTKDGDGTRNPGVFVLYASDAATVVGVEVHDLDRQRDYGGGPAYWLGPVDAEQSLSLLKGIAESKQNDKTYAHTVEAIALHDTSQANDALRTLAHNSPSMKRRAVASFWLGQLDPK